MKIMLVKMMNMVPPFNGFWSNKTDGVINISDVI